jgi:hypothetical protein
MAAFLLPSLEINFLVPFLFLLAIVFGVLELASPIKNRAVNTIISLAIALFAASYGPFLALLWGYLPSITWFFIVMFFLAFVMELFGLRKKGINPEDHASNMVALGAVFFILISVGWSVLQQFPVSIPILGGGQNLLLLLGLIFLMGLFWGAFKMGLGEGKSK